MADVVVVMGVSGSGKTTVGQALAERLGVPYAEADEFHPQANIDKMVSGVPLTDADREPWLREIAGWIGAHADSGGVVTCSALKRAYRDLLRAGGPAWFLHLHGPYEVIAGRMAGRGGHFMPPSLLASQFADLQPLAADEPGHTADVTEPVDRVVADAVAALR